MHMVTECVPSYVYTYVRTCMYAALHAFKCLHDWQRHEGFV